MNRWTKFSPLLSLTLCLLPAPLTADERSPACDRPREGVSLNLLPVPETVTLKPGQFVLTNETRIFLPPGLDRPESLAGLRLRNLCQEVAGVRLTLDRLGKLPPPRSGIFFAIKNPPETDLRLRDGYTLIVDKEAIHLTGNSPPGLFYGIQTLSQLVRQFAPRLPTVEIVDEPDFAYRGFFHDVSRGKVPKLETLKELADFLAFFKVNQLQLNIEHTFAFRFDPEIAENCSPLQPDEILELVQYCNDRRIDLVPSLQTFGHLGHILSMPKYRQLADVELEKSWEEMTWRDRMQGATLNPTDPEARRLLERMLDNFVPLFTSPFFNANADETFDLGNGKTKELADEIGKGRLYLNHIEWLNQLCKKYGKRMMFWGDVVKHHSDLVGDIPKDTILLNWGYHAETNYQSTRLFADAGLDVFVCPGTSGWNRILNGINNADLNIRRYAAAGKKYGALGLLNTDWGDFGHYNLFSCSLHGMVLGAAMAWNAEEPQPAEFDRVWNTLLFDDPQGKGVRALREQAWAGDGTNSWIQFHESFDNLEVLQGVSDEQARELIGQGKAAARVFERYTEKGRGKALVNAELRHASLMNALLGEKILLARKLASNAGRRNTQLATQLDRFADQLEALYGEYELLWRERNKESNLRDIRKVVEALISEARSKADALRE